MNNLPSIQEKFLIRFHYHWSKVENQPQTMMFPPLCFEVLLLLCSSVKDSPKYVTFQLTSYQQIRQHSHIPVANIYLLESYYEEFNIILTFIVIGKLNKQKQKKNSCYFKPSKFYPYKCCLINTPWLDLMNSIYIAHIWVILIVFLTISCEPKVKEVFNTQFLLAYSYFLTCSWKVHFVCY